MQIFRVAHADARDDDGFPAGPYYGASIPADAYEATWSMCFAHTNARHPNPNEDFALGGIGRGERCGFDSEAALLGWFEPKWRNLLRSHDFRVYEYEVPRDAVRVGAFGQALFQRAEALLTAIREIPNE